MIASLKGTIDHISSNKVEISAGTVGWEVYLPQKELAKLTVGSPIQVFTYQHIAEDKNDLFGFTSRQDKLVFEILISVSGIGPKTALGIFSVGDGQKIMEAVAQADLNFFSQVKGLGSKGAQRIIVDLKNKVKTVRELDLKPASENYRTAQQALADLGFKKEEIKQALAKLPAELDNEQEIIKFALKNLAR